MPEHFFCFFAEISTAATFRVELNLFYYRFLTVQLYFWTDVSELKFVGIFAIHTYNHSWAQLTNNLASANP